MKKEVLKGTSKEFKKLDLMAKVLTGMSATGTVYFVGNTYLDLGQDWMWTTIIAHTPNGDSYQALSPREWEEVLLCESMVEMAQIAEEHFEDKYCCDKKVTF